jgi:hypothetical protein
MESSCLRKERYIISIRGEVATTKRYLLIFLSFTRALQVNKEHVVFVVVVVVVVVLFSADIFVFSVSPLPSSPARTVTQFYSST